jgi:hypothetical protein
MDKETKTYGEGIEQSKKKIEKLKDEENKLKKEKDRTSDLLEKTMSQVQQIDKDDDTDRENKEEKKNEEDKDDKGTKIADQDLERVLNFYGDMDKPNNEKKIKSQQINTNQRDW